jgi:hypothetical protein
MWLGEMDTEMPGPVPEEEDGEEAYWMKWMREVEETLVKNFMNFTRKSHEFSDNHAKNAR